MRLFLDIDIADRLKDNWLFYVPSHELWDDTLPLVRMEAHRLHGLCPKLGNVAVIERSSGKGWFLKFPHAQLSKEEEEVLMIQSPGEHRGHLYFSLLVGDTTIRFTEKPRSKTPKPYLREIIRFAGSELIE